MPNPTSSGKISGPVILRKLSKLKFSGIIPGKGITMHSELVDKKHFGAEDLVRIMQLLRSENGCPWDRAQTHKTIRANFLEETYEVLDALDRESDEDLCEELGDVLLQIVFHSRMAEEEGRFGFDDVVTGICKKLIIRHPHIFAGQSANTSEEVLDVWDRVKREQKGHENPVDTLSAVPKVFPSLMRAGKVYKRATKTGLSKLDRDLFISRAEQSLKSLKEENPDTGEISRAIFALAALAGVSGIDAEGEVAALTDEFIAEISESSAE